VPAANASSTLVIDYQKLDLFSAPTGSLLAHACNCHGVWGSGIAVTFKATFPKSFEEYKQYCRDKGKDALGTSLITSERVACLFTSFNYGVKRDPPHNILMHTAKAVTDLLSKIGPTDQVFSNKFNSGFFGVPWEHTEEELAASLLFSAAVKWTVCTP